MDGRGGEGTVGLLDSRLTGRNRQAGRQMRNVRVCVCVVHAVR
jgi:hypothetical protein